MNWLETLILFAVAFWMGAMFENYSRKGGGWNDPSERANPHDTGGPNL